jgi:hypothetical protein
VFRYYGDLVRNLADARNASVPLILTLRLVSKIILTLGGINIIGFRANIAVVDYYYYYTSISACSPRAGTDNIHICAPL